jgi:hypothetical protein
MSMQTVSQAEQALAERVERFSHWRRNRANTHERIPAPRWDQAVVLSQVLPNGQVAKALGLSATAVVATRRPRHLPFIGARAAYPALERHPDA